MKLFKPILIILFSLMFGCAAPMPSIQSESMSQGYVSESDMVLNPLSPSIHGDYFDIGKAEETREILFPGSASSIPIRLRTYTDIDRDITKYKTFAFDYTSKDNRLLEKELFRTMENILVKRGLVRSDDNPDLMITMNFFVGKREQYIPPQTIVTTHTEFVWTTGMIGFTPTGQYTAVPVTSSSTIPGETKVTYYRNIRVNFLDMDDLKKAQQNDDPPLVKLAEVESEGDAYDIRTVAPEMLGELVWDFPEKSSHEAERIITRTTHSGIGIGVDINDWTIIRYVFPDSPAAQCGLLPGDQIVSINGQKAKHGPRSLLVTGDHRAYQKSDPYYHFILSNKKGEQVQMMVKSSGTKPRLINITPREETHIFYTVEAKQDYGSFIKTHYAYNPVPWQ